MLFFNEANVFLKIKDTNYFKLSKTNAANLIFYTLKKSKTIVKLYKNIALNFKIIGSKTTTKLNYNQL